MRTNLHIPLLFLLTTTFIFSHSDARSQTGDTTRTINFPLPHEDFSLYDFAEVRFETDKTETPPADIIKRNFQPVKKIFPNDSLHFDDSVRSVWIKIKVANNLTSDTSVALIFPYGVSKAVLYKSEGKRIVPVGKTGWAIAVIARTISYEDSRMDLALNAHSQTNYFIQIINLGVNWMWMPKKMPVLENIAYSEIKAFNREKEVNRPNLLWLH